MVHRWRQRGQKHFVSTIPKFPTLINILFSFHCRFTQCQIGIRAPVSSGLVSYEKLLIYTYYHTPCTYLAITNLQMYNKQKSINAIRVYYSQCFSNEEKKTHNKYTLIDNCVFQTISFAKMVMNIQMFTVYFHCEK